MTITLADINQNKCPNPSGVLVGFGEELHVRLNEHKKRPLCGKKGSMLNFSKFHDPENVVITCKSCIKALIRRKLLKKGATNA